MNFLFMNSGTNLKLMYIEAKSLRKAVQWSDFLWSWKFREELIDFVFIVSIRDIDGLTIHY